MWTVNWYIKAVLLVYVLGLSSGGIKWMNSSEKKAVEEPVEEGESTARQWVNGLSKKGLRRWLALLSYFRVSKIRRFVAGTTHQIPKQYSRLGLTWEVLKEFLKLKVDKLSTSNISSHQIKKNTSFIFTKQKLLLYQSKLKYTKYMEYEISWIFWGFEELELLRYILWKEFTLQTLLCSI